MPLIISAIATPDLLARISNRISDGTDVAVRHCRSLVPEKVSEHVRANTSHRSPRHDGPPEIVQPDIDESRLTDDRDEHLAYGPVGHCGIPTRCECPRIEPWKS